ncbi:unnamed protein product [Ceratitis capitata]|uniref:DNA topoisomerase n=1 Tax=Ceratitis capitata TaxID=7213 RepID=W8BLV1_CERCA|nr:unnamed protein product [Ceratitis capitata]
MIKSIKCYKPISNLRRLYGNEKICNMKYLNVAEKNDAAKTIAGLLSNGTAVRREGYSVYNKIYEFSAEVNERNSKMVMTSVSGHLLQLSFVGAYRRWDEVDPQALFNAPVKKVCPDDYQPIKRTLEREIRSCGGLIVWTDCDREGENIGYEIIDVCLKVKPNIKVWRAIFSEITKSSVRRALNQLKEPDKRLNDAVDVRTELDLRTGAAITRFQTLRLQRLFPAKIADKLISYGSCQIPTLGFVAERYKDIEAFVSEPFWKLKVSHTIDDLTVDFLWARNRLFDKAACEDYLLLCLADPKAKVQEVTTKSKHKWRPTPLDTVEMEKLGSRKLKISAKEVMTIAEKLYSKGIISYPRTETNQFSKDIDLHSIIERFLPHPDWGSFTQRILEWGPNPRNGNKSDQAHPPIHPIKLVTDLQGNDARVYELICRHFLACVSKDAVGSETVVNIDIAGEKFTATGLCIHERNYLDIYIYEKWNAKQIHKYEQGQLFDPTEITMQEGATTAPPLLTEADLIALMEKHGIGTDATHAEHINTIKERGYIGVVDKGGLVPGIIGMGLYEGYDAMDLQLAKPKLRAEFESDLKDICSGKKDPKAVLKEQIQKYLDAYKQITEKVAAMDNKMALRINETLIVNEPDRNSNTQNGIMNSSTVTELFLCPKCSVAPLALRQKKNRNQFYIGCMNFPDCKNAIWLSDECLEPSVLSETCQTCGPNIKMLKLKFNSIHLKNYFNTPSGWYKTCLRCDKLFRDYFNINLDKVKTVGGIVEVDNGSITSVDVGSIVSARSASSSNASRSSESSSAGAYNRSTSGTGNTSKTRNATKTKAEPKTNTLSKTNKANGTNQTIRNFFTTATTEQLAHTQVVNSVITDEVLDDFLNVDDDFDAIISTVDLPRENLQNTNSLSQMPSTSTTPQNNRDTSFNQVDSTASTGNEFNFDDSFPDLEDFVWGTAEHNKRKSLNPINQYSQNSKLENSTQLQGAGQRIDIENNLAISVKCSGCHQLAKRCTVVKEGPNKGRPFYVCAKKKPCKYFQWADETSVTNSSPASTNISPINHARINGQQATTSRNDSIPSFHSQTEDVKCNCGIAASSLIVRKEGPNKSRPFFTCSNRDASCGFFKWKDDDPEEHGAATSSNKNDGTWGSKRRNESSNEVSKKRKCRLCRQEGHTRVKCPRKSEFDL